MSTLQFLYDLLKSGLNFIVPVVLIGAGIFFLWVTKFVQIRMFPLALKRIFTARHDKIDDDINISSNQSFYTGLAQRIGIGNIAGVASAITAGGPGAVFWMWFAAFLGMGSSFCESSIAQLYKTKNEKGEFVGGPAFYLAQGLKMPRLGVLFSIFLAFTYGIAFNMMQANQIAGTFEESFAFDPVYVGVAVTIISGAVIFSSLKFASRISGILIAIVSILYIGLGTCVLVVNHENIGPAFKIIFTEAFNLEAGIGGLLGTAVMFGIKRGLFSNAAGMGADPNIAASAATRHPAEQGMTQMIGVFVDTFIVCTFTALIILTTGLWNTGQYDNAALTAVSINVTLGDWTKYAFAVLIFFIAFTSIISQFLYALSGLKYFTQNKYAIFIFTIFVLVCVFLGSIVHADMVWDLSDVSMAGMTILNLFALVLLWKQIRLIVNDYQRQLYKDKKHPWFDIYFNSDLYPELQDKIYHTSIWSRKLDEEADDGIHKNEGYKLFGENDTNNHR
ncbi:hypothetical protein CJP74_04720 [Psittacicella melopsittaci]|uniref:Sodium:alanine symporter family protein n=1 Tax=Psittacicella melopsittaci TaxID=2028576 RepID=A0A3A1Y249_9GAMM|nr:alanine/glycine:cation symporter family protein [Psittacicella melopsittaci]RIY32303.1 hypothetical protein CJP74_04720 [Psittacicella melopsittaci]